MTDTLSTTLEAWTCEQHPWLEWPHDDCAGPGMPVGASLSLLRRLVEEIEGYEIDQDALDAYLRMPDLPFPSDYLDGYHKEDAHHQGLAVGEALAITSLRAVLRGE